MRLVVVGGGAGQAGLTMSHRLSALGVAHVVLERGRVTERWRSERWDTLRLLTPNWISMAARLVLSRRRPEATRPPS